MPLIYKTLIPILVVLLGMAGVIGFYFEQTLSASLLTEEFFETGDRVDRAVRDLSLASVLASTTASTSDELFGRFVERVKNSTTARITIWSPTRTIQYSDLAPIIGTHVAIQPYVDEVVASQERMAVRKEFDDGIPVQSAVGAFTDMYFPITHEGEVVGVVEIHSVLGAVLTPLTRGIENAALLVFAGLIVVVGIIIFIFRFFILSPLARANALSRAVSAGNFEARPFKAQKDELGELMKNLDIMRTRLASLVGNLEAEVEKRTHQLHEEETRLSASLGSLDVGFAIFDTERRIIYQNHALALVLKESKNFDFTTLTQALAGPITLPELYEASRTKRTVTDIPEIELGNRFFHLFMAPVVMPQDEGKVLGVVMLLEDVTEAKMLERAKDDFLSIASHELRTPLTAIRANASLVREVVAKTNDADALAMLDDIHGASVRLIKIVHDFLDVAALERGVPVELHDGIDLRGITESVIEELSLLAKQKKLTLRLEAGDSLQVRADADRLKQVITNLVGNALRYTTHGSVLVSLANEGNMARIRVTDTGAGISSEHQSLLFKKFQQADQGVMTREHSEGTGLGLYITKLIMESMGGSVSLEKSVRGTGSVFCATIPLSKT